MSQPALDFGDGWKFSQAWTRLLEAFNATIVHVGRKEAAYQLDTSPSQLANALAERDRHHIRGSWVPYLVAAAPNDAAVEVLAGLRGRALTEVKKMTPAEELAALKRSLGETVGHAVAELVYAKAGVAK